MSVVLAIDGGSQSTKVSVVDAEGRVHATAQVPLQPYALGPDGRAVHPDDDLWDTTVRAVRDALARLDPALGQVVAVGLCGIRSCRALVGADGRLVEPVLSWMDARVIQPLRPTPGVATVCSAGGYLAIRLTGQRRDSAAAYRGTWPLDEARDAWSDDPADLARTGMPRELLPELVPPGGLLGRVLPEVAEATGLPAGVPVVATANDKAVEALGCGLLEPGTTLLSLGTYVAAMTVGEPVHDDAGRVWANAACVPGRRLLESRGVRRGMWTVSWLRRLVGSAAPEPPDPAAVTAWLEAAALEVPPGCGGLMAVPDWLPPPEAPHRRGLLVGLDGSHDAPALHRAVLEGIVLTMARHVEAMEEVTGRADRLVVSGGGARSALMVQLVADALERPVERAAEPDAAGIGAAVCATVGAGLHLDAATAVAAMVRPGTVFPPGPQAAAYRAVRAAHDRLVALSEPMLAQVYPS